MDCEKVDIAHFLQLDFARVTPPSLHSFLISFPSYLSACLFLGVESRRGELQRVCSIYFLTVHNMYWKCCFLTLALHYMRSECFPEVSTHQTFHLIWLSSNIKYMLLDNKFSEKLKITIILPFINKTCNKWKVRSDFQLIFIYLIAIWDIH